MEYIESSELVSVCVPVYNGQQYLEVCFNAILSQTYSNIEILIVDDGSSDESSTIIKHFQTIDKRIRLLVNESNLGLVGNWKQCIDHAKGKWIKFLFQDDMMQPDCVEKMVAACEANLVNICFCSREFIIEESANNFLKKYFTNGVFKMEDYFSSARRFSPDEMADIAKDNLFVNFIGEPIVLLFSKECINLVGNYNTDLVQQVDYEFALRVCLNMDSYFLPEKLVQFRIHSNSASNNQSLEENNLMHKFVEPLVMFHEYLFNPFFNILRQKCGTYQLFKKAVIFYKGNKPKGTWSNKLQSYLLKKYKGIRLIRAGVFYVRFGGIFSKFNKT